MKVLALFVTIVFMAVMYFAIRRIEAALDVAELHGIRRALWPFHINAFRGNKPARKMLWQGLSVATLGLFLGVIQIILVLIASSSG